MTTNLFLQRGGQPFAVEIRRKASTRCERSKRDNAITRRGLAVDAALYASDNSVGIVEAASKFGATVPGTESAWRRLFPGVPCLYRTRPKLDRAVDFVIAHDTTIRKAAAVFGVDRWELVAAYNRRTGKNRQLVGESPERMSLSELERAGNREAYLIECGGVE